ncbi:hypothetical protein [Glaciecola sp. 1036]|uniref:hypothetical protein n=1 Tax=Alteromonadaceae TaxID=72275 RepID=UPI003D05C141
MYKEMLIRSFIILLFISFASFSLAKEKPPKVFKVGVNELDHYPLFDFNRNEDKGLAWTILEGFAKKNNYEFEYIVMSSVKLQNAMESGQVDFVFPDNPLWSIYRYARDPNIFSLPVVNAVSATFVTLENRDIELEQVSTVAIPYGYSAVTWLAPLSDYEIDTLTTSSLKKSIQSLYRGTSTAADIEYNIAQHLIEQSTNPVTLVVNPNLPNVPIGYHLSTIKHILIVERFSHYLINNAELIDLLRQKYGVKEYEEVFGIDGSQAKKRWLPKND